MSTRFRSDLEALLAAVDQVGSCSGALGDLADDVRATVAGLHDSWSGLARDAHGASHDVWSADFAQLHSSLGAMRAALHAAHEHYAGAAHTNREMWARLR